MKAAPWKCEMHPHASARTSVVVVRADEFGHWWPRWQTGLWGDGGAEFIHNCGYDVAEGDRIIHDEVCEALVDPQPCDWSDHDGRGCLKFRRRVVR